MSRARQVSQSFLFQNYSYSTSHLVGYATTNGGWDTDNWIRPLGEELWKYFAFIWAMSAFVSYFFSYIILGNRTAALATFLIAIVVTVVVTLFGWIEFRRIWWSTHKLFKTEGSAAALVEAALRESGLEYRREDSIRTFFGNDLDIFTIPSVGLNIHLDHVTWACTGPVAKENRDEVDRLKELVDEALG